MTLRLKRFEHDATEISGESYHRPSALTAISVRDGVTDNPLTPLDTPTGTCEG
jgi:hypothetical protein